MDNTSDNKMVSIILLSYKNLDGVYETLDSIFIQNYPELEIIISDDGTPGFDDEGEKTLEEIGQMFKLTRERIRQIESKAIRKLRHPSRQKKLRG